jgi:hypothetical protein
LNDVNLATASNLFDVCSVVVATHGNALKRQIDNLSSAAP